MSTYTMISPTSTLHRAGAASRHGHGHTRMPSDVPLDAFTFDALGAWDDEEEEDRRFDSNMSAANITNNMTMPNSWMNVPTNLEDLAGVNPVVVLPPPSPPPLAAVSPSSSSSSSSSDLFANENNHGSSPIVTSDNSPTAPPQHQGSFSTTTSEESDVTANIRSLSDTGDNINDNSAPTTNANVVSPERRDDNAVPSSSTHIHENTRQTQFLRNTADEEEALNQGLASLTIEDWNIHDGMSNNMLEHTHQQQSSSSSSSSPRETSMMNDAILSRSLLTSSIHYNPHTKLWIVTIDTTTQYNSESQPSRFATLSNKISNKLIDYPRIKRSSSTNGTTTTNANNSELQHCQIKAFTFPTESEAREASYANSPPRMLPFSSSPTCHICTFKFSSSFGKFLKRAVHCRNCGVCICSNGMHSSVAAKATATSKRLSCCHTTWSKCRIPETYNYKSETRVKICKNCDWLSEEFERGLLDGNLDEVVALYETGNINLRRPFGKKRSSEIMFPIHCAAEGGSLPILKWLVETHHAPIFMTHIKNNHNQRNSSSSSSVDQDNLPILTSKGRSILHIAMSNHHLDIVRYLVVEKQMSIYGAANLKMDIVLGVMDSMLRLSSPASIGRGGGYVVDLDGTSRNAVATGATVRTDEGGQHASTTTRAHDHVIHNDLSDLHQPYPRVMVESTTSGGTFLGPEEDHNTNSAIHPSHLHLSQYETNDDDDDDQNDIHENNEPSCTTTVTHAQTVNRSDDDDDTVTAIEGECVLCFDRRIDCVMTPCGHQISCMECSSTLSRCPICCADCTVIRIFKP